MLASLYASQIFIPSACGGKGSCGHCKITVTAGGGPVLPTETAYLSRKEMRSNVRLACQVKIREDMLSERPHAMHNHCLQGTEGCYESARCHGEKHRIWLSSLGLGTNEWIDLAELEQEYLPPMWRTFWWPGQPVRERQCFSSP